MKQERAGTLNKPYFSSRNYELKTKVIVYLVLTTFQALF